MFEEVFLEKMKVIEIYSDYGIFDIIFAYN
jgi:hypothetical protein